MKSIIETFCKFNCGRRRPDRDQHLRFCGFSLVAEIDPSLFDCSPREYAKHLVSGKPAHIVYLSGGRNMDGARGYRYYKKEL